MCELNQRECFIRIKALAQSIDGCLMNGSDESISNALLLNEMLLHLCEVYETAET